MGQRTAVWVGSLFFVMSAAAWAQVGAPAVQGPEEQMAQAAHDIDRGQAERALKTLADVRAANPAVPGLDRETGLALYAESKLPEAEKAFAAALAKDPRDSVAAQFRGLTLYRLGRPAEAIPLLEQGRAAGMGKADPNYVLALCYMDTRRYDDARHAFAAQYGFAPDSAAAYLASARMLLRREYVPVAQGFAEKALALDPKLPLAHELLGEIALAGGKTDDAIRELEAERAMNPVEPAVYDRLGDAYFRTARYDDAQRVLEIALLLEPHTTGPYILLGKTLLKKGDVAGAATFLEHARDMDPANYMTHSLLGTAYRAMGRPDDASRENATAQRLQTATEPKLESVK